MSIILKNKILNKVKKIQMNKKNIQINYHNNKIKKFKIN